ncbi:hypothetical protein AeMF1_007003 [Aphanomyces euteiches]|nr:hypothetical protein AeMF1_007003 [Aphanomyces euteiches]KAH9193790.1 hypothetical protein AeNC1_004233 [Aphanomyces euteiches]
MDPYEAVGCGIEVFRSPQESWVRGKIEEYDVQVGFRVLYENGDEQWEDASNMERLHIQPREDTSTSARLQHDYMTLDLKRECVDAEFYDASDDEENNATPTKYAVNQGSDVVNKTNDHEGNTNTDQMTRTSDIKDTSLTKKLDVELLETHGKDESSNSLTMDSNSGAALTTINKSVACLEHDPQGSPTKNNYFNSRDSQLCSMNAAQLDPKEFDERHDNTDCSTGKSNACWTQPSPELSCSLVAIDSFQDKGRNERSSSQIFKSEETAICDNLGENSSSSKRAVLPDICLNETNMVVISDYKPRFEFEVQSAQLDDELHLAFISGQVLYFRSEPQVEWRVFVKVSMVRPGSHSLTNRNTTTIYTTDTITTSLQPSWIDSIWSHLIRCPGILFLYIKVFSQDLTMYARRWDALLG